MDEVEANFLNGKKDFEMQTLICNVESHQTTLFGVRLITLKRLRVKTKKKMKKIKHGNRLPYKN